MSKKVFLQRILLHFFIQKKSTVEAHKILVETCCDHALSETSCRVLFRHFKNHDFDVEDKEHSGTPKKFEDELVVLLNDDSCQVQAELAESLGVDHTTILKCLKALRMIQKQGHWVPYELKLRDVKQSCQV